MLRLLAEGGGAVEALWRQKEPGFVGPGGGKEAADPSLEAIRSAVERSRLRGASVPLYEITIVHGGFLARIDLLRVSESTLEVVEMKAKSVKSRDATAAENKILGTMGKEEKAPEERTIRKPWIPYLQDLAFQKVLLKRWLQDSSQLVGLRSDTPVVPGMILVNARGRAKPDDVLGNFRSDYRVGKRGTRASVSYVGAGCTDTDLLVEMAGIPDIVRRIESNARADDPWLSGKGIEACMQRMAEIVQTNEWPAATDRLGSACKKCEFRTPVEDGSGFQECWGGPRVPRHVLTLPYVGTAQVQEAVVAATIRGAPACNARAIDAPEANDERQRTAWHCLQSDPPIAIRSPHFGRVEDRETRMRKGHPSDPCHFLDFECAAYPIPQGVGRSPYQWVPFQFEAHTLPSFDADLSKRIRLDGFLDLTSDDPRYAFVRELRRQLGDVGVIYHWHHYEETVLNKLRESIVSDGASAPTDAQRLVAFIDSLVGDGSDKGTGRLCDLKTIAQGAFYHPDMQGSYSIKRVLPVVWQIPEIRTHFWPGHGCTADPDAFGNREDPYLALPALPRSFLESVGGIEVLRELEHSMEDGVPGLADTMKNGGMAMLFYHYVRMFGGADRPEIRAQFRNYCGLDSAAMIMVFRYMTDVVPDFRSDSDAFRAQ
jgi:hypothetical protein